MPPRPTAGADLTAHPEELSWADAVVLHAESVPPAEGQKGFRLRAHADAACPARLSLSVPLVERRFEGLKAESICTSCAREEIASSVSTVVVGLRDRLRSLEKLIADAASGPQPREIVYARAVRFEAAGVRSIHPDTPRLQTEVIGAASEAYDALRRALITWDAGHAS